MRVSQSKAAELVSDEVIERAEEVIIIASHPDTGELVVSTTPMEHSRAHFLLSMAAREVLEAAIEAPSNERMN